MKQIHASKYLNPDFLSSMKFANPGYVPPDTERTTIFTPPKALIEHLQSEPKKLSNVVKEKWNELGPVDLDDILENSVEETTPSSKKLIFGKP